MLGVDVSRHQPSGAIDWQAWKRAGVGFCWVKGTDGFGLAPVERADRKVRDCKAAGIPVGLYGYAQLGDPVQQANVLVNECNRLDAWGIYCALDLEDPHPATAASRPFAISYLRQLKNRGVARPVLYANTSMLRAIGADTIVKEVPGTLIWHANYGVNNGRRHALPATKFTTNIHQYTSTGRLPGYSGNLDLNEAFDNLIFTDQKGSDDVSFKDPIPMWNGERQAYDQIPAETVVGNTHNYALETLINVRAMLVNSTDEHMTEEVYRRIAAEELAKRPAIEMAMVVDAVKEALGQDNEEQANAVVDAIGRKLQAGG